MDWKEYKLGDLITFKSGGTPPKSNENFWGGTIPWVSAKNMYTDFISTSTMFITEEGLKSGSQLAPIGSILLLTRGSGLFNTIPICLVTSPVAYNQDVKCIFTKDDSIISNEFLFYWMISNKAKFVEILETTGIGAGKIATDRLLDISILVPPMIEQGRLLNVAKSILGKIENNNKINAKLEEMAQALFKSWFIDFEPFKDGNFVESELGMIPEGWKVGILSDLIEIKYGKDHKKLAEGIIPVYGSGGLMRRVDQSLYEGESVLIPRKGTLNNVMYVNEKFWTVDTMFYSKPFIDNIMKYVFLNIIRFDFEKMNQGTSIPSNTTDNLNKLSILIPDANVLKRFDDIVSGIYIKIKLIEEENRQLAQTRDTLLPKLMSGEIDIPEEDILQYCKYYKGEKENPFEEGTFAHWYWRDEAAFFKGVYNNPRASKIWVEPIAEEELDRFAIPREAILALPKPTQLMFKHATYLAWNMNPQGGDKYLRYYGKSVEELNRLNKEIYW